jgi:hypothetical protein
VSDRRREQRFSLSEPADGALTVFPDVVVHDRGDGEWIGTSRQPVSAGEAFVIDVVQVDPVEGEVRRRVPVCVVESRPVLVDGEVCYRIRLHSEVVAAVWFEQHVRRG